MSACLYLSGQPALPISGEYIAGGHRIERTSELLFKHIFGKPEHKPLLIDLVNSILSPDPDRDVICDLMLADREISPEI